MYNHNETVQLSNMSFREESKNYSEIQQSNKGINEEANKE